MQSQANLTHPKYRKDIDGLRAVAVMLVVGFHAFPKIVKSGFIGVNNSALLNFMREGLKEFFLHYCLSLSQALFMR